MNLELATHPHSPLPTPHNPLPTPYNLLLTVPTHAYLSPHARVAKLANAWDLKAFLMGRSSPAITAHRGKDGTHWPLVAGEFRVFFGMVGDEMGTEMPQSIPAQIWWRHILGALRRC